MNKSDLTDAVMVGCDITKAAAGRAVDAMLTAMRESLAKDGEVKLAGFGNFTVKTRAARTMRNPQTGDPIDVPEKQVVKFKPASALTAAVN